MPFVERSFLDNEISSSPGGLPYRWAIKAALPISFAILALAAFSRLTRVTSLILRFPAPVGMPGTPELGGFAAVRGSPDNRLAASASMSAGSVLAFGLLALIVALETVLIAVGAFENYVGYIVYLVAAALAAVVGGREATRPIAVTRGGEPGFRFPPRGIAKVLLTLYAIYGVGHLVVETGLFHFVIDAVLLVFGFAFVELAIVLSTFINVNFNEILSILMFVMFLMLLFTGFPIAWLIGGIAVAFTAITVSVDDTLLDLVSETFPDYWDGELTWARASASVQGIWGQMSNGVLVALPMFIFMGLMLDRSGIAEKLMDNFVQLFGRIRGGYAVTITLIGVLLAASTGIIGASVVLLTLLGLPVMLRNHYSKELAVGTVSAVGTLGILIPPSIMLVLMADQLGMSVGDLFMGALFPGLLLGGLYITYILGLSFLRPGVAPAPPDAPPVTLRLVLNVFWAVLPPAALILAVLGTIFFGVATPTEASGVGAAGATLLAVLNRRLTLRTVIDVARETTKTTAFIFAIILGAVVFALVLRWLGGDELIENTLLGLNLGAVGTVLMILGIVFLLGFVLDWIQIILIVLVLVQPIVIEVAPQLGFEQLLPADADMSPAERAESAAVLAQIWFTVLFAVVLQTSFLTPPVGFALFYVKGVAPPEISVRHIYAGVVPFIALQLIGVALIFFFPQIVTYLPQLAYGTGG